MSVAYSRSFWVVALSHFRSAVSLAETVGIVGLRRLESRAWRGWCIQLARRRGPPEAILEAINRDIAKLTGTTDDPDVTADTLREPLEEDSALTINAIVKDVTFRDRQYISVLVSGETEIQESRQLRGFVPGNGETCLAAPSLVRVLLLRDFQVRIPTGPCRGTTWPVSHLSIVYRRFAAISARPS